MSDKLPSIHFYPGDWWKDAGVQSLDHLHKGIWFELLLIMFDSGMRGKLVLNGSKYPSKALAKRLALDEGVLEPALRLLVDTGVAHIDDQGILFNKRMVLDEDIRQKKIRGGSAGGRAKAIKQKSSIPPSKSVAPPDVDVEDDVEDLDKNKIVPGKTKISEFVHLSDVEREDVLMEFKRFGLEWKHVERACVHLDRWLAEPINASKRRYAPLHLKTWGLKEVMKDQATKNDLGASENRRKGIRPSTDPPRPRSKTVDEIMQEQLGKI